MAGKKSTCTAAVFRELKALKVDLVGLGKDESCRQEFGCRSSLKTAIRLYHEAVAHCRSGNVSDAVPTLVTAYSAYGMAYGQMEGYDRSCEDGCSRDRHRRRG